VSEASLRHVRSNAPPARIRIGSLAFLWLLPGLALALVVPTALRLFAIVAYDVIVLAVFAFDARRLWRAELSAERELEPLLRVGTPQEVRIRLSQAGSTSLRARVRDAVPRSCDAAPQELETQLGQSAELSYRLMPRERGAAHFSDLWVRLESSLRLAAVDVRIAAALDARVLPRSIAERARARAGLRREEGEVRTRLLRASQSGGELESLREYVRGDALRAIDWKATAKRRHPITRLYQPERSQVLWIVLDASRTMSTALRAEEPDGLPPTTRFDVALDVALQLARTALRAGDMVGAIVYADERLLLVPPGRGRAQQRRLLDALYDREPVPTQLDVRGLLSLLDRNAKKRSLLVVLTDLENETHGELFLEHARLLQRRHLPLLVSLDDAITQQLISAPSHSDADVYQRAAAVDLAGERMALKARLETRGIRVIEASEAELATAAIDRYVEIKTRLLL
jgi:uncharacterized protein (DUF58 family)